jgi:hypothetical protein
MLRDVTIAAGAREVVELTASTHHRTTSATLPLAPDPYLDDVRPVASTRNGGTRIESSVDGATVWIDGHEVGLAPADPRLSSGRHTVEVRADGHQRAQWSMTVADGAVTHLAAQLEPARGGSATERATPFYTRWWFWTILGVAAIGGAVALTWELTRSTDSVVHTFEALSRP